MARMTKAGKLLENLKELREGAGAAVTFHFNEKDRDFRVNVNFECQGNEIKVSDLIISDYYYSQEAFDGGKFIFAGEDLKNAVVEDHNEWSGDAEHPIKKEDIKSVEIVGVEEMPNLSCSWGWVRSDIPSEMIITKSSNGYYAILQVDAEIGEEKTMYTVEVDGKYIPSEEVIDAYNMLGEDEEEYEESLKSKRKPIGRKMNEKHDNFHHLSKNGHLHTQEETGKILNKVNLQVKKKLDKNGEIYYQASYGDKYAKGKTEQDAINNLKKLGVDFEESFKSRKPIGRKINETIFNKYGEPLSDEEWNKREAMGMNEISDEKVYSALAQRDINSRKAMKKAIKGETSWNEPFELSQKLSKANDLAINREMKKDKRTTRKSAMARVLKGQSDSRVMQDYYKSLGMKESMVNEKQAKKIPLKSDKTGFVNSVIFEKKGNKIIAHLINKELDATVARIVFIGNEYKFDNTALTGGDEELMKKYKELDEPAIIKEIQQLKNKEKNESMVNEKVNRWATEGEVSDNDYLDTFEYIYSQRLNGNISDYKAKLKELQANGELKDYQAWANEFGVDPEIVRFLESKQETKPTKKSPILEELHIMITLGDYTPWSGAVETFEKIEKAGKLDDLEFMLEDMYPDGIGQTELNDLLWFDSEWVLAQLGIEEPEEDMEESLNRRNKTLCERFGQYITSELRGERELRVKTSEVELPDIQKYA